MATPTRDDFQASGPYLCLLAQHLQRIAKVDEMLLLREEIERTNRVIVPTSLIGEEIEEAYQGPGIGHEGVKKVLERLVHSNYSPGMKKDVQLQVPTCHTYYKFHSASKRQPGKLHPIPTNERGDILAIDVFGGKASMPQTPRTNPYILTMSDLFRKFAVAAPMPEQSAQTVADSILSRWVLLLWAPWRFLTDQGDNFESAVVQKLCTIWRLENGLRDRELDYHTQSPSNLDNHVLYFGDTRTVEHVEGEGTAECATATTAF